MSEAEKKKEYDLFTDYNPENYALSWDNYKVTGFRTLAEYSAYTKAREDEQKVCFEFLKNWNYGEINSAFGAEIQKKVEAATLLGNKDVKAYLIKWWDFEWQLAIVIAKNEQSARKKFKKAMPEYEIFSIEERMIIK